MASAIHNALKRKKELERELAEIHRFLSMYDQFSGSPAAGIKASRSQPATPDESGDASEAGNTGRLKPAALAQLMEEILDETGKPMQRYELVAAVEARGFKIESEDKPRYLGTILWRHRDRFVNISGQGYTLATDMPADEAEGHRRVSEALGDDDDVAGLKAD